MKTKIKKAGFRVVNTTIAIGAVLAIMIWADPIILICAGAWQFRVWSEDLLKRANQLTDKLIDNENSNNSTR